MVGDQRDIHWENLQAALAQLESAVDSRKKFKNFRG